MNELNLDQIGYYGKPISTLSKDELRKVVLELSEIINNCPVKGNCGEIVKLLENILKKNGTDTT